MAIREFIGMVFLYTGYMQGASSIFLTTPGNLTYTPPEKLELRWTYNASIKLTKLKFAKYSPETTGYDDLTIKIFSMDVSLVFINQDRMDYYSQATLRFNRTTAADEGIYRCCVTVAASGATVCSNIEIRTRGHQSTVLTSLIQVHQSTHVSSRVATRLPSHSPNISQYASHAIFQTENFVSVTSTQSHSAVLEQEMQKWYESLKPTALLLETSTESVSTSSSTSEFITNQPLSKFSEERDSTTTFSRTTSHKYFSFPSQTGSTKATPNAPTSTPTRTSRSLVTSSMSDSMATALTASTTSQKNTKTSATISSTKNDQPTKTDQPTKSSLTTTKTSTTISSTKNDQPTKTDQPTKSSLTTTKTSTTNNSLTSIQASTTKRMKPSEATNMIHTTSNRHSELNSTSSAIQDELSLDLSSSASRTTRDLTKLPVSNGFRTISSGPTAVSLSSLKRISLSVRPLVKTSKRRTPSLTINPRISTLNSLAVTHTPVFGSKGTSARKMSDSELGLSIGIPVFMAFAIFAVVRLYFSKFRALLKVTPRTGNNNATGSPVASKYLERQG